MKEKNEKKKEENVKFDNLNDIKGIKTKIDNIESNFHIMCEESNRKTEEIFCKMEEKNLNIIKGLEIYIYIYLDINISDLKERIKTLNTKE